MSKDTIVVAPFGDWDEEQLDKRGYDINTAKVDGRDLAGDPIDTLLAWAYVDTPEEAFFNAFIVDAVEPGGSTEIGSVVGASYDEIVGQ